MYLFIYFSNILFIHLRAETSLTLLPHIRSLSDSRIAPIAKYLRLVTSVHQKERMNIHTHLLTAPHRERHTHTHRERGGRERSKKERHWLIKTTFGGINIQPIYIHYTFVYLQ